MLTDRQRTFALAYAASRDGAAAARHAGYAARTAKTLASRLLKLPAVAAEIERERQRLKAASKVMTPLEYLLGVMRDPGATPARRLRAATVAAKYMHAPAERAGKRAAASAAAQVIAGSGRFSPPPGPKVVPLPRLAEPDEGGLE